MRETYYITTPIYYLNGEPHIGHTYTSLAADAMARYKRARGYDVKFLTGTDEHGQKVEQAAAAAGTTPKELVDGLAASFKRVWAAMDISYDTFIRTTDAYHEAAVQKIFKKLYDQGDIYKGSYEGWYCTPCETFLLEHQLKDGKCPRPECGRPVERVSEACYFFRLSAYQDRLERHYEENPDFLLPLSRRNEMINTFIKPGLEDLCVSRTTFTWGVPVDFDPGHVVYVWIDALSNYINALGYMSDDDRDFKKYWPADVHLMSKEITRFHAIIWPCILMALGEALPRQVFCHGWLQYEGKKIGKSLGNAIDPYALTETYGVDAIRYFLLREFTFGPDGDMSQKGLITRINADLANDLGNLLSRTVGMVDKYFGGALPAFETAIDPALAQTAADMLAGMEKYMDKLMFSEALAEVWTLVRRANKYIDERQPWALAKDDTKTNELANVLYHLAETLRILAVVIAPVMPRTPAVIRAQLHITDPALCTWESAGAFGLLPPVLTVSKGPAAFPRIDVNA